MGEAEQLIKSLDLKLKEAHIQNGRLQTMNRVLKIAAAHRDVLPQAFKDELQVLATEVIAANA